MRRIPVLIAPPSIEVVESQQRLVTITIIFALLRDLAFDKDLVPEFDGDINKKKSLMGNEKKDAPRVP